MGGRSGGSDVGEPPLRLGSLRLALVHDRQTCSQTERFTSGSKMRVSCMDTCTIKMRKKAGRHFSIQNERLHSKLRTGSKSRKTERERQTDAQNKTQFARNKNEKSRVEFPGWRTCGPEGTQDLCEVGKEKGGARRCWSAVLAVKLYFYDCCWGRMDRRAVASCWEKREETTVFGVERERKR